MTTDRPTEDSMNQQSDGPKEGKITFQTSNHLCIDIDADAGVFVSLPEGLDVFWFYLKTKK